MKKFNILWAFVLVLVLCTVSCKQKPVTNSFGFYTDLDAGKAAAKKSRKNILLYICMEGLDTYSEDFRQNVLESEEYKELFGKEFESVFFDFGSSAYAATELSAGATKKETEAAEMASEMLRKNMKVARSLNVQYSPTVFLLNKDGYCFADEPYAEDTFASASSLMELVHSYNEDFELLDQMVEATKKGSPVERVNAINEIYESVPSVYLPTYADLFRSVPDIDKKNESGLVSTLYMEAIIEDGMAMYAANDFMGAVKCFQEGAESGKLEPAEQQQAYYMAGQLLGMTGSNDYQTILNYFNLSVQAYPESEEARKIQNIIDNIVTMLNGEKETETSGEVR